ncbi:MAG: hypothetical protein AMJ46_05645 [Latescibacteria bacterium DG_63]|nr:MAG: hypothetical protein AMJ46_05645 [Latescibacteria bacterium DG_63]
MNSAEKQAGKEPEWRVIRILDEYRIVVNAPFDAVKTGDKLQVYRDTTAIVDPETQEPLGILPDVLATVEVVQRELRFCVAESADFTMESPLARSVAEYAQQYQSLFLGRGQRQMLPIQPENIERVRRPAREGWIEVGDKVRKTPKPEGKPAK